MNRLRIADNLILLGVALAAFFWMLEAVIHVVIFNHGDLMTECLRPGTHELWMRLLICFILISFSIYAQATVKRLRQAKMSLQQSYDALESRVSERTAELDTAKRALEGEIEERKAAEEEKFKLLHAVETAKEAIHLDSPDGIIEYANEAMDGLFGYEKGELVGKHVGILNVNSISEKLVS
mgnify:CR=1 FL=1